MSSASNRSASKTASVCIGSVGMRFRQTQRRIHPTALPALDFLNRHADPMVLGNHGSNITGAECPLLLCPANPRRPNEADDALSTSRSTSGGSVLAPTSRELASGTAANPAAGRSSVTPALQLDWNSWRTESLTCVLCRKRRARLDAEPTNNNAFIANHRTQVHNSSNKPSFQGVM